MLIFSLLSFLLFPNLVVKFLSAQDPSVEDSLKIAWYSRGILPKKDRSSPYKQIFTGKFSSV